MTDIGPDLRGRLRHMGASMVQEIDEAGAPAAMPSRRPARHRRRVPVAMLAAAACVAVVLGIVLAGAHGAGPRGREVASGGAGAPPTRPPPPSTASPGITVPTPDGGYARGGEPSAGVTFVGQLLDLPLLDWHTSADGAFWDASYLGPDDPESGAVTFRVAPLPGSSGDLLPGGSSVSVTGAERALYRGDQDPATLVMVAQGRLLVLMVPADLGVDQAGMTSLGTAIVEGLPEP